MDLFCVELETDQFGAIRVNFVLVMYVEVCQCIGSVRYGEY